MRAIVFSGGGMFGAYQVGVWKVLSAHIKPDLIVGVSIGSMNAWMVAGGCDIATIEQHWLEGEALQRPRLRIPRNWREGFVDPASAHAVMQRMFSEMKPKIPLAIVVRRVPSLRTQLFVDDQISSWRHIAASCAIPLVFDLQELNGHTYADGGLIDPLPLYAARDLRATSILGINCMSFGGFGVKAPQIRPRKRLGWVLTDGLAWNRANVVRWIAQGEEDANAFLKQYSQPSSTTEKTFAEKLF